ncbi:MAG: hypothetical protein KUG77_13610 [Nannocystaceae bacterium]|nr:hypothetical protein [Nannocystaceae bacterium]
MTFETRGRLGFWAALLLSAASCDKGSVGEFGETDGGSGGASEGLTTGASASASAGSASAGSTSGALTTAGSTGGVTEGSSGSDSGASFDTGTVGFCENPLHGCDGPVDCGENCGALDSMFDEDGCVRVACGEGDTCGDGELCYRPMDYGGCQSSDLSCSEFDGVCGCGSLPDCGGAYCVPDSLFSGGIIEGPTNGFATNDCGPADGPAFVITLGNYASNACGGEFDAGPQLSIFVNREYGAEGTHTTTEGASVAQYSPDGTPESAEDAQWVVLHTTQWDGLVEGAYQVLLQDETVLVGTFEVVVSCPSDIICG